MPHSPETTLRVIHSVDHFLNISENWIYPQITRVPGVESAVLCQNVTNLEHFPLDSSRIHVSPPPTGKWGGLARFLYRLGRLAGWWDLAAALELRTWRPNIVHAHFGPRGCIGVSFKRWVGASALVTSFYGADAWMLPKVHPVFLKSYATLFSAGDLFLVEGAAMRERLRELGCPVEKIRIHHIGVDLPSLPFAERAFSGELKVIMIARFCEKKGFPPGLEACARARARGMNLKVTIVGGARPGDAAGEKIAERLRALAATPALAGHVDFAGFLPPDRMRATLQSHDVFLCPSQHASDGDAEGGSPVVLTEAMACGLVCIGTRHCDIPEVIRDGGTGYLAAEGDVESLADALCQLKDNAEGLHALVQAGRRHIEESFALDKQAVGLQAIYSELTSRLRAPAAQLATDSAAVVKHPIAKPGRRAAKPS